MSSAFSDYQKKSDLHCLSGCGKCCTNPDIEASPLEMIPLALKILDENKLDEWLEKLENSNQKPCILYESHSSDGSKGACGSYLERPSICRMFGVAGRLDKYQKVSLSICKLIKENYSELYKTVEKEANPQNTPLFGPWTLRLSQLDPDLIQKRMPINQALKKALEKVALYAQYQER